MPTASKTGRLKRWVFGALALLAVLGAAWFFDFPAIPDDTPQPLAKASISSDTSFYVYSLGGFIDRSYSWRIDAPKSDLDLIIKHLELHPSPTVPKEFWRVSPFYWPRSLASGMVFYRSVNFTDDSRGSDGPHYFLLHDTARSRAYVLFKDNYKTRLKSAAGALGGVVV
jgi:hypothetical protein